MTVDIAELFEVGDFAFGANATQVQITGNLSGGGSVSTTIILDLVIDGPGGSIDFQTIVLSSSFVDLTSAEFAGLGGPGFGGSFNIFSLDNIVVTEATSAPEPSTLALFATGLALLAFLGWRRRGSVQVKAA